VGTRLLSGPTSRIVRFWRAHPEVPFLLCLVFFYIANYGGFWADSWAPWTFRELTLQLIPDPVVPFTVGATISTAVVLTWALTPRVGVIRAALVGVSTPVGAVGLFELAFLFIVYPSAFWFPAHLSWVYWDYGFAILSFALFGFVGGGWWRLPRWWWPLFAAVALGFVLWYAAGVPLPVADVNGHLTSPALLGIALVGNVVLKWAVFVLVAAPILMGARHGLRTAPDELVFGNDTPVQQSPRGSIDSP